MKSDIWTSGLIVMLWVGLQALAWVVAVRKLNSIRRADLEHAQRLQHLQAIETYFDLPLYFGLLGTVMAFLLIAAFPSGGLMFGYVSTGLGLLVAVVLRLCYLVPYRQWLIGYARPHPERPQEHATGDPETA